MCRFCTASDVSVVPRVLQAFTWGQLVSMEQLHRLDADQRVVAVGDVHVCRLNGRPTQSSRFVSLRRSFRHLFASTAFDRTGDALNMVDAEGSNPRPFAL